MLKVSNRLAETLGTCHAAHGFAVAAGFAALLLQLPQVVYVDDPRMFGLLAQMFPDAQLVQDAFHLLDRFSRAIPATNTLKGEYVLKSWKTNHARSPTR